MVADLQLENESDVTIEEFSSTGRVLVPQHTVVKNDTLTRMPIRRDQMLFWSALEGGVDWDGNHFVLKAYDSGRAHLRGPSRPLMDPSPLVSGTFTVPSFSPYRVILFDSIVPGSVVVLDSTGQEVPSADYTVDSSLGHIDFVATRASSSVFITYQPRISWSVGVIPDDDGLEICFKVGLEAKQVFPLGAKGVYQTIKVDVLGSSDIGELNVTVRRQDDSQSPFQVRMADWQPRGEATAAIRYTISTSAVRDYDWASSGLIVKSIWPNIDLLRAKLDGTSTLSRFLDSGKMVI